jgi:hypothetical protein
MNQGQSADVQTHLAKGPIQCAACLSTIELHGLKVSLLYLSFCSQKRIDFQQHVLAQYIRYLGRTLQCL